MGRTLTTTTNHCLATFLDNSEKVQKYAGHFNTKRILARSADPDDAKMLLDIPFSINHIIIDQLALNLINICLDNRLQISCKSFLCFAKIEKIDLSKIAKIFNLK